MKHWKARVLEASRGSTIHLAIQRALNMPGCPVSRVATLEHDGTITCDYHDGQGRTIRGLVVGRVPYLWQRIAVICDRAGLSPSERGQLQTALGNWITVDNTMPSLLSQEQGHGPVLVQPTAPQYGRAHSSGRHLPKAYQLPHH